ncbi:MAG: AraC family transcriptional regulator [Myxococcaceae bacterium]|nr:AraC family transcriptional regulator [Myxococcaceae bacterium]
MTRTVPQAALGGLNAAAVHVEVGLRGARAHGPLLGLGLHVSSVPVIARAERGQLVLDTGRRRRSARAVAVAAGVRHALEAPGVVTVWYLEPGTLDWPELWPRRAGPLAPHRLKELHTLDAALLAAPGRVAHPGVARALDALRDDPSLGARALADVAHLSPSRLRHAFVETVGVNASRYRWWLRLRVAALALRQQHSLTEAAHEAGFSDAAHFSRTFRRAFGFPPSRLVANTRW